MCAALSQAAVQVTFVSQRCELLEMISPGDCLMAFCFAKTE
jgi:hypothetical protein